MGPVSRGVGPWRALLERVRPERRDPFVRPEQIRTDLERRLEAAERRVDQARRAAGDYPRDSSAAEHWLGKAAREAAAAAQLQWNLDNHETPSAEWSLPPHLTEDGRWAR